MLMRKTLKLKRLLGALACTLALAAALPMMALANGESTNGEAWIGNVHYDHLEDAVAAAQDGDTITLGEGQYTLYKGINKSYDGTDSTKKLRGMTLTFVGQGSGKTSWRIGPTADEWNPQYDGTEFNGDYTFDSANTITFKEMSLESIDQDYLGFIRIDNTIIDNCVINGETGYWGYKTAKFTNTTFNAPTGRYALWTYCSPVMSFDGCVFNSSGKAVNVYGSNGFDVTVNVNNCTVNATGDVKKPVFKINDAEMKKGERSYTLNFTGENTINGDVKRSTISCSRWFGFDEASENTGVTTVTIDGTTVYKDGAMVAHEIDTASHKYTEGYEDNAYTVTSTEWTKTDDGSYVRTTTKVCNYCGYSDDVTETGYRVTYTDGVDGEEIFADQSTIVVAGGATPEYSGDEPTRDGYVFKGWEPELADTVTENVTYTAVWEKDAMPEPDDPDSDDPDDDSKSKGSSTEKTTANESADNAIPKTGDNNDFILRATLLGMSALGVAGAAACSRKRSREE